jgi:hypothetical protein
LELLDGAVIKFGPRTLVLEVPQQLAGSPDRTRSNPLQGNPTGRKTSNQAIFYQVRCNSKFPALMRNMYSLASGQFFLQ